MCLCACFRECVCLTSSVLAELCCDEATFCWLHIKITCPSLGPDSSLCLPLGARHLVSLTHTGLQHRCLGPLCMCASVFVRISVCVCAPPASPQQDCQSVCDYTPTHLLLICFLTIPLPPLFASCSFFFSPSIFLLFFFKIS